MIEAVDPESIKEGSIYSFLDGKLTAEVVEITDRRLQWKVQMKHLSRFQSFNVYFKDGDNGPDVHLPGGWLGLCGIEDIDRLSFVLKALAVASAAEHFAKCSICNEELPQKESDD